jgi:histidinol-phosphate aminotransferase
VNANRYPGNWRRPLVEALSKHVGVPEDKLVMGAGSTEILQMAVQAFQSPRGTMVIAEPTFEDVPRYQRPFPYEMVAVPVTKGYEHDIGRMREVAEGSGRPSVVYFCNPNSLPRRSTRGSPTRRRARSSSWTRRTTNTWTTPRTGRR